MPQLILVVEDDPGISLVLRNLLQDEGFRVRTAGTGEEALVAIQEGIPDLAIVDLRLPRMQGIDVVRRLRQLSTNPVLIVSALADSHDIVAGLEGGADDYVVKPFANKELVARVRASLRRPGGASVLGSTLTVGDLTIDFDSAKVFVKGKHIPLTRTEFEVLQALARADGRAVSRAQLLTTVWRYEPSDNGRVVDNLIYRLRGKIEVDPDGSEIIVTVRGFGYRLTR